ncbi:DUF3558 domain-containing protein [Saccharomonospora piscinae]|uniref:DUF3558 domain-containing protein n=1 Tax=Saccharomonospora piscinae TaxID=687388 RepID=UPI003CC633E7
MGVLSGCSSETPGVAEPPESTPEVTSSAPASDGNSVPRSRELEPCDLLSVGDLDEYGAFEDGEYKDLGSARSCSWQLSNEGGVDGFVVALNVRDSQNVDSMNDVGAGIKNLNIDGRTAARVENPRYGDCTVGIEIDAQSRVDVTVNGLSSTEESCPIAEDVARVMEPRLPAVP